MRCKSSLLLFLTWSAVHGWRSASIARPQRGKPLFATTTTATWNNEIPVLKRMIAYFESMVDPESHRFYLLSEVDEGPIHTHCPLRDLGSAWDAAKAVRIARQQGGDSDTLLQAIRETTQHYSRDATLHLSEHVLQESPNIAHNGLLLLACIESQTVDCERMTNLVAGILERQRSDGAFRTHFGHEDALQGIAFFPGEAMTALMEVYLRSSFEKKIVSEDTVKQILPAMLRALAFYRGYYQKGKQDNTMDSNYSIWQIQAFSRLVVALRRLTTGSNKEETQKALVVNDATQYCLDMCYDILQSPAWKMLSRGKSFYANLSTVEIACGLDALAYARLVLVDDIQEEQLYYFTRQTKNAVDFLEWSQNRIPVDATFGYGGLGYGGYCVTEQRLDVTGHALSALANMLQNE